ncbi:MAG: hypothetical protein ABSH32_26735, partial [Bryobacteraceae bacterium]
MTLIRTLPALLCASAAWGAAAVSPRDVPFPVYFEPNQGQADGPTTFLARGPGYTAFLQQNGAAVYYLSSGTGGAPGAIRMELRGAKGSIEEAGEKPLSSITHYYSGNEPGKWRPGVPHYR